MHTSTCTTINFLKLINENKYQMKNIRDYDPVKNL